ncbi:hypothetical protein [Stigmatella erecta]|uniref:Uncharacterized protein n=1 Tax=Stigmatella erecta TaxID=83460 RepID=A0A1I0JFZ5_9BACT|nr:hypothetical protein [Stigmatella erecta]SEU09102.1 hypothetical protein SAMN05443639_107235 [Stigmatella erecta]
MSTSAVQSAPVSTTAASNKTGSTQSAKDLLQPDGSFVLTDELKNEAQMGGFMKGLGQGEEHVTKGVEKKMAEWAKSHPNADAAAFKDQLKKTLMSDSMSYSMIQRSIQKFSAQLFDKMKEMASDRFG